MNRGSNKIKHHMDGIFEASMRPRFMNRGSPDPVAAPSGRQSRFNEAPIHESGKSLRYANTRSRANGFNEAPIHESGK